MIIRYGDNVLVDFFENYLQQAVKSYLAYKSTMDDQFKKWLDMGMGFSEVAQKSMMKANPFQAVFEELSKGKKTGKKEHEE
jgi:hypothetical protein